MDQHKSKKSSSTDTLKDGMFFLLLLEYYLFIRYPSCKVCVSFLSLNSSLTLDPQNITTMLASEKGKAIQKSLINVNDMEPGQQWSWLDYIFCFRACVWGLE